MIHAVEIAGNGALAFSPVKRGTAEINWVKVAVEMAGGIQTVTKKLGVTRATVYRWISQGTMRRVAHEDVVHLSTLSRVPVEKLTMGQTGEGSEERGESGTNSSPSDPKRKLQ